MLAMDALLLGAYTGLDMNLSIHWYVLSTAAWLWDATLLPKLAETTAGHRVCI